MYVDYKKVKIGDKVKFHGRDDLFGTVINVTVYPQFGMSHVNVRWHNHKGMYIIDYRHTVGVSSQELTVYEEG